MVWKPLSEADVQRAIDEDALREGHYFDAKRQAPTTDGARGDLAKDLASFAIDGGSMLIGVAEDKTSRTWTAEPQPLAGLAERVDLIAATRVDPPLHVACREIPSAEDSTRGYLWISVEPSAHAPHMVNGAYYGRGDQTNRRLSDAEVLRLHETRAARVDVADRLLTEEIQREPMEPNLRSNGHLYLVAQPLVGSPGLAQGLVRGPHPAIRTVINSAERHVNADMREISPTPRSATLISSRARGVAISSTVIHEGRQWKPEGLQPESRLLDIELGEDGGIRVLSGRLSEHLVHDSSYWAVRDGAVVAYCVRLVHWARALGDECGYHGPWSFGVAGDRLTRAMSPVKVSDYGFTNGPLYDRADYRSTTTATGRELREQPERVVDRLVGPLLRALETHHYFAPRYGVDPS